jgi:hypothetical protein
VIQIKDEEDVTVAPRKIISRISRPKSAKMTRPVKKKNTVDTSAYFIPSNGVKTVRFPVISNSHSSTATFATATYAKSKLLISSRF